MKIPHFQVNAFTVEQFRGNPAAICPLNSWLGDNVMQAIATENNLSETAFFVREGEGYRLRWFTPASEVDLCGHATLATAHVLFNHLGYPNREILFHTRSGELRVERDGAQLVMDFPALKSRPGLILDELVKALGSKPRIVFSGDDYMAVFPREADIRHLEPDMELLKNLKLRGVIVTAPGESVDFVSRFFAPKYGIPEDPVTGSAHCMLTPYWAAELGKSRLTARQISARGGDLECELVGDRVKLRGQAITYTEGVLYTP